MMTSPAAHVRSRSLGQNLRHLLSPTIVSTMSSAFSPSGPRHAKLAFRFGLCIALAASAPLRAAVAPANSEADEFVTEAEIARLEAEQTRLIEQIKRELAALPERPVTLENAAYRARRAQLAGVLAEVEERIRVDSRTRYVTSLTKEPAVRGYYARQQARIEQQGSADFPKVDGVPLYGEVIVSFALTPAGKVERIQIVRSTSSAISEQVIKLLRQLEPFERFPPEIAKDADRMVITTRFAYERLDK